MYYSMHCHSKRQAAFDTELKRLQVLSQHIEGARVSHSLKIPFTGCREAVTISKISSSLNLLGFLASWSHSTNTRDAKV